MKIVFAGTPAFAATVLQAIIGGGYQSNLLAVITQPDKEVGRKHTLTPTPVKLLAQEAGIPVYDWQKIRDHVTELKALGADCLITCAYGQILTQQVLDCFPKGVWNIHASLLPKYRGASPIQSAILAGEAYSGITVMKTALALDSGDILLVKRLPLAGIDCTEAQQSLAKLGGEAALDALALLSHAEQKAETITDFFLSLNLLVQDEAQVTYCKKITREDAKINWNQSAQEVVQKIRAFVEEPVAWCLKEGQPFNIYKVQLVEEDKAQTAVNQEDNPQPQQTKKAGQVLSADKKGIIVACGSGSVRILSAQLAGGKILSSADLVNGRKIKSGDCLE